MNFLFQLLKEDKTGWIRLLLGLVVAGFWAGMYYNKLTFILIDHDKRIARFEKVAETIPDIKESLARIEGSLRIRR